MIKRVLYFAFQLTWSSFKSLWGVLVCVHDVHQHQLSVGLSWNVVIESWVYITFSFVPTWTSVGRLDNWNGSECTDTGMRVSALRLFHTSPCAFQSCHVTWRFCHNWNVWCCFGLVHLKKMWREKNGASQMQHDKVMVVSIILLAKKMGRWLEWNSDLLYITCLFLYCLF